MNAAIGPKLPLKLDKKDGFLMITNYVDEVKQNVRTLFLTSPGERVRDPLFGIGLKKYLFESRNISFIQQEIKSGAYQQIKKYMPFVILTDLNVSESPDEQNTIFFHIQYFIQPLNFTDQITIPFNQ